MMTEDSVPDNADDGPEGRYANHFDIGHNAFEVVMRFGQFYEGSRRPVIHTRIVTSPAYALALLRMLGQSMAEYEARFGPITTGGQNE